MPSSFFFIAHCPRDSIALYANQLFAFFSGDNLQQACKSCSLTNGLTMTCSCKDPNGNYQDVTQDLSKPSTPITPNQNRLMTVTNHWIPTDSGTEIQDNNGILQCNGHLGDVESKKAMFLKV